MVSMYELFLSFSIPPLLSLALALCSILCVCLCIYKLLGLLNLSYPENIVVLQCRVLYFFMAALKYRMEFHPVVFTLAKTLVHLHLL